MRATQARICIKPVCAQCAGAAVTQFRPINNGDRLKGGIFRAYAMCLSRPLLAIIVRVRIGVAFEINAPAKGMPTD